MQTVALAGLGAGVVAGTALLISAPLLRRRGTTPFCRGCGYNLTGNTSGACPECGRPMTQGKGPRVGTAPRRWPRVLLGLVLLLGTGVPLGREAYDLLRGYDWYRLRPTRWVMVDLQSTDTKRAERATWELERRAGDESLSISHASELIDYWLDVQDGRRSVAWPRCPSDRLAQLYHHYEFSAAQIERLCSTHGACALAVRPRVAPGDPVPFRLTVEEAGPPIGVMVVRSVVAAIRVDGEPRAVPEALSVKYDDWWFTNHMDRLYLLDSLPPGEHELAVDVIVSCTDYPHDGSWEVPDDRPPIHTATHTRTATFTVMEEEPTEYIRLVPFAALQNMTESSQSQPTGDSQGDPQSCLRADAWYYDDPDTGQLWIRAGCSATVLPFPFTLAMHVIGYTSDRSFDFGYLTIESAMYGLGPEWISDPIEVPDAQLADRTLTLVMTPAPDEARRTVGIYEICSDVLRWNLVITADGPDTRHPPVTMCPTTKFRARAPR